MTAYIDFERNELIELDGIMWSVNRRTPTGVELVGVGDRFHRVVTTEELIRAFEEGRLLRSRVSANPGVQNDDFAALPESARKNAALRKAVLVEVEKMLGRPPFEEERLKAILPTVLAAAGYPHKRSTSSVRRWLSRDNGDPYYLAPRDHRKGARGSRLDAVVEGFMRQAIDDLVMCPLPDPVTAYDTLCTRIDDENQRSVGVRLEKPSRATFYRRLSSLDDELRLKRQFGKREANKRYRQVGQQPAEFAPYGTVEIDHTWADCHVVTNEGVPIGRPYLSIAIDRCTKMIAGYVITFIPPSIATLFLLTKAVILGKGHLRGKFSELENDNPAQGLPREIVCDNPMESHSPDFRDAMAELGIVVRWCPTQEPDMKGSVERMFGTLNTGMFNLLAGTSFRRVGVESDRDPAMWATYTLRELEGYIVRFLFDVYHQRKHRTLRCSPIANWIKQAEKHPLRFAPSRRTIELACLRRIPRTVQRTGIELNGFYYHSEELRELRVRMKGKGKVAVRWDQLDLGRVYVQDPDKPRFIEVPCQLPEAKGMNVWEREAILKDLGANAGGATVAQVQRSRAKLMADAREKFARKGKAKIRDKRQVAKRLGMGTEHECSLQDVPQPAVLPPLISSHSDQLKRIAAADKDIGAIAAQAGMRARKGIFK